MLNHQEIQELILDHDWSAARIEQARLILGHLDRCTDCQQVLGDYDRLRAELSGRMETVSVADPAPANAPISPYPGRPSRRWIGGLILAMAASLLVAATASITISWMSIRPEQPRLASAPSSSADLLPAAVSEEAGAFDNIAGLYDGRTGWLAISNHSSTMGLTDQPVASLASRLLVLRLTLWRGGTLASSTDLVIVPGQSAQLDLPFQADQKLRYHVSAGDTRPTSLSIWVEIIGTSGQGETLAALATQLRVEPNQVAPAGELATSSAGYQLKVGFREAPRTNAQPKSHL